MFLLLSQTGQKGKATACPIENVTKGFMPQKTNPARPVHPAHRLSPQIRRPPSKNQAGQGKPALCGRQAGETQAG